LKRGDRIILYTDAITETRNETNELFGAERFLKIIEETREEEGDVLIEKVFETIDNWKPSNATELKDDATLIILDLL